MIGTDPQLGVAPANEAEIFVILSPGKPRLGNQQCKAMTKTNNQFCHSWSLLFYDVKFSESAC